MHMSVPCFFLRNMEPTCYICMVLYYNIKRAAVRCLSPRLQMSLLNVKLSAAVFERCSSRRT